jgi:N utilization substance protein B
MATFKRAARRRARRFALQAIYQWQLNPEPSLHIADQFLQQAEMVSVDTDFFKTLLTGVTTQYRDLDSAIEPFLIRSQSKLQEVERAILRMSAYELKHCPETPYRVIMNEAIELTKAFAASTAHKYVNGILHALATQYRPFEVHANHGTR